MASLSQSSAAKARLGNSLSKKNGGGSLKKGGNIKKSLTKTAPNYRGGTIKSTGTGSYGAASGGTPAVPPTQPGDINTYLGGDSDYQDQLRQLSKALSDFQADVGRRKGTLESEYGISKKALGDQRGKDLQDMEADYAGRGMLKSGLYAGSVGDYEKEYGNRVSDLDRQQQQALQLLMQEQSQYGSQNDLEQQRLREEAIRRRAEQYGM
jgi:hypothetical protein